MGKGAMALKENDGEAGVVNAALLVINSVVMNVVCVLRGQKKKTRGNPNVDFFKQSPFHTQK
jgi:hypothetical protein